MGARLRLAGNDLFGQPFRIHRPLGINQQGIGQSRLQPGRDWRREGLQAARVATQGINGLDYAAEAFNPCAHLGGAHPQMLAQQPVAKHADCLPGAGVGGFDRQVAFGVQAHGGIVEVGRADSQQTIVDHHELAVHVDWLAELVRNIDPQPPEAVGGGEIADQTRAQHLQGIGFRPAAGLPRHHHHLGSLRFHEPVGQGGANGRRGEILVLDVDALSRRSDGVQIQILDFMHFGPRAICRLGARDHHLDIG